MATLKRKLNSACYACQGEKTIEVYENGILVDTIECPSCDGLGKMTKGWIEMCADNVFESHVILECLDATEHNALTDAQKDGVLAILACGQVDLNDGKAGRVRLWNWFGSESTTVANLTALLT